jgi:hypothetical protein
METDNGKTRPPYVAYATFKNFLGSLKAGAIPSRIDRSLMPGMAGSVQSYVMYALRFFGLIDDKDAPTDKLEALVASEGEARKELWKELFAKAYAPIIGELDLTRATSAMLNEKFLANGVAGETARKAYSFFTAWAQEAEIPMAESIRKARVPSGGGGSNRKARRKAKGGEPAGDDDEDEFGEKKNESTEAVLAKPAVLLLDGEGKRLVRFQAPATVSKAELSRIQQWLKFQLIVEG